MKTRLERLGSDLVIILLTICVVFPIGILLGGCEGDSGPQETQTTQGPEEEQERATTIWYSGVRNVSPWVFPNNLLDIDNGGQTDFQFEMRSAADGYFVPERGNLGVGPLSAGSLIDGQNPNSGWSGEGQWMARWMTTHGIPPEIGTAGGMWAGVSNGYMGLAFTIDGTSHYGWARITIPYRDSLGTLHDWAYETRAGVGIKAGQTE